MAHLSIELRADPRIFVGNGDDTVLLTNQAEQFDRTANNLTSAERREAMRGTRGAPVFVFCKKILIQLRFPARNLFWKQKILTILTFEIV